MRTPAEDGAGVAVSLAFDGSLHACWVARYALRLVRAARGRSLGVLHARDGGLPTDVFQRRLAAVRDEAGLDGVRLAVTELDAGRDVADALLAAVPPGPHALLVCGTRASARHGGLLAGSVAARLLRAGHCQVLAMRVLEPGLLAAARRVLLPVRGSPGEVRDIACWLRLLAVGVAEMHLLRVMETDPRTLDHAPREQLERLRAHGRAAVTDAERQLHEVIDLAGVRIDGHVRLDHDWMHAGGVVARAYRCDLMLAAASDHQLGGGSGAAPLERLLGEAPCDTGLYRGPG